jgi:hypothetical protein
MPKCEHPTRNVEEEMNDMNKKRLAWLALALTEHSCC